MPGSQYAGTCQVAVEGRPLSADIEVLLTSAVVEDHLHLPDVFELRFRDPNRVVLAKSGLAIGARVRVSVDTSEPGAAEVLITGQVTAVEVEIDGEGTLTTVRGDDRSHVLRHGTRVAAYVNMSYADIARKVAGRAGLAVGTIKPAGAVRPHVAQGGVDDWTFLTRLGAEIGFGVSVEDGKLSFAPPPDAGAAPTPRGAQNPYVLEPGTDLLSLRAVVNAAEQVPKVEVRSWDPHLKKEVVATVPAAATTAALPTTTPAGLATRMGATSYIATRVPFRQHAEVKQAATALAGRIGGSFAEIEGVVRGDPRLRAGTITALADLGEPFDGSYVLSRARHVFDPDTGYSTEIAVTGAQDRSLLGLTASGGGAARQGVAVGIVTDAKDPEQLGRVKLTLPWLAEDYVTDWAPTVQAGAGRGRGALVLPEVHDQVLVAFEQGDLGRPYVLGGLHSNEDKPPMQPAPVDVANGKIVRRAFVSRTGHKLEFLEQDCVQDRGVNLATGDGKLALQLDSKAMRIAVTSDGTVLIDAARGIRITSSAGDIAMAANKITLDARMAVEITGSTGVTVATNGKLDLSGTVAALQGKGTAELKGGAMTTITGALVKIN